MPLTLTLTEARRLAVTSQLLAGKRPPRARRGILETVRPLRRLQLDPTAAVAPGHLLVLWSRLGRYDPADLDALVRKGTSSNTAPSSTPRRSIRSKLGGCATLGFGIGRAMASGPGGFAISWRRIGIRVGGTLRLLQPCGDLRAEGDAAIRLLCPTDPPRRPSDWPDLTDDAAG